LRLPSLCLALGLAACSPTSGAGPAPLPEPVAPARAEGLDRAVQALIEERLAAARAAPAEAESHGALALVYEANDLWAEAAASLENAVALAPADATWRYHLAIARGALGESERELAGLTAVADELLDAAYAQHRLGEALLARGDAAAALPRLQRATALAPERAEPFTSLGAAELALGEPVRAAAALERAVALDPRYKCAHYQLGLAYRALGKSDAAERELALGLGGRTQLLPDPRAAEMRRYAVAPVARLQHALALLEGGKPERAARILAALHEEEPEDLTVLNDLAIALQRQGEYEAASALLGQAKELDPELATTWINLSVLLLERGLTAGAREHAERAVALAPESSKAHLVLARARLAQDERAEACAALETSVRLDPRAEDALALLAETELALERLDAAQRDYEALARLRPFDPGARAGLGEVALRRGARDAAAAELGRARALGADHPAVVALARALGEG